MASKGARGKKVVNQEELRRLMREKKQSNERQKRVESPYARYSGTGALSCVLCNVPVKSEILWQVHILSKQHRDKVQELKTEKRGGEPKQHADTGKRKVAAAAAAAAAAETDGQEVRAEHGSGAAILKRKAAPPEPEGQEQKKLKSSGATSTSGLPADFFQSKAGQSAGLGLLAGQYDDDNDEEEDVDKASGSTGDQKPTSGTGGLPADFFDSSIPAEPGTSHSGSISKAEEEKPVERRDNMAEVLPEGFFDDPVRDAKVRNVDTPKDHMDKEWEEFQKEMRQVNSASEAIVAEEDEEGRIERQIDEIDEQIECLRRVEALRTKQEAVKDKAKKKSEADERQGAGSEEDEEEDEEELLHVLARDWRAKGALA